MEGSKGGLESNPQLVNNVSSPHKPKLNTCAFHQKNRVEKEYLKNKILFKKHILLCKGSNMTLRKNISLIKDGIEKEKRKNIYVIK